MTDPEPINLDRRQPAFLRLPGLSVKFESMREALRHWQRLAPEDQDQTTLILQPGTIYHQASPMLRGVERKD